MITTKKGEVIELNQALTRFACICLCVCLLMSVVACGSTKSNLEDPSTNENTVIESATNENTSSHEPLLEFTYFSDTDGTTNFVSDKNDVFAKVIKEKFNIVVKEVSGKQGMSFKERLNLFIASGDVPDVVMSINDSVTVPATGRYAAIGDLLEENAPNLMKAYPKTDWWDSTYNGEMYVFPNTVIIDGSAPENKDKLYLAPMGNWAGFWISENNLRKLGYSFTPIADIAKKMNDTQTKPSYDDFAISPAISTPDEFYQFLKKIKETMPKVNGKNVIPFNTVDWGVTAVTGMYGLANYWKYDPDTKKVSGSIGDPMAKDAWNFIRKLYQDGLLDRDFSVQKSEQIQEKAVQGRSIVNFLIPNPSEVVTALQKVDPNDNLRVIPMPIQPGTAYQGLDGVSKATFKLFISKDVKDIPRLIRFFDWCLSEEANDLRQWGPEELGLWEIKDGKKQWKDPAFKQAVEAGDLKDYPDVTARGFGNGFSKTLASIPYSNAYSWTANYDFNADPNNASFFNQFVTTKGVNWTGTLAGGVDEASSLLRTYTLGEFLNQQSAKLFTAKSDEEFNKNWEDIFKLFMDRTKYAEGKKRMEQEFKLRGFDVVAD